MVRQYIPVVGSSRRRHAGEVSSSAAMATRLLSPPDTPLVKASPIRLWATCITSLHVGVASRLVAIDMYSAWTSCYIEQVVPKVRQFMRLQPMANITLFCAKKKKKNIQQLV